MCAHEADLEGTVNRTSSLFVWMLFFALLLLPISAMAQEATPYVPSDDEVNAIAKDMYCPVCENTPLDVCPTQACEEWRQLIREQLAQGWSEEQIKQFFVERYGARVLSAPPPRGINWLVYVMPPLAFIAGVLILVRAMRAWKAGTGAGTPSAVEELPAEEAHDEYLRRVEEELKKL